MNDKKNHTFTKHLTGIFIIFYCIVVIPAFGIGIHNEKASHSSESRPFCHPPKIYAIQTNVTDLKKAVSFYQDLGFILLTKDHFPRVAPMMNTNTLLALHRVEKLIPTDPRGARTTLNMRVKNLNTTIAHLQKKGIEVIHKKPQKAAVGLWKAIRDPFGNVINLIEAGPNADDLKKPRVNNVSIVGTDIDQAVRFYSNILGLEIFSVKYYPVIPLQVKGVVGNIALHDIADKKVKKIYPNSTQTFLVFEVPDLISAMEFLKSKGVELLHDTPQKAAVGIYVAFRDPFGLVHEIIELKK